MKKLNLIGIFILLVTFTQAQTDNEFWFAAPDISNQHGNNGIPLYLHVSASQDATVTISRPADPTFTPYSFDLNEGQSHSVLLIDESGNSDLGLTLGDIECHSLNQAEQNGFLIESDRGDITAFYEMNNQWNRDIFTLKGKSALGQKFTVTTQNVFHNADATIGTHGVYITCKSGFVIVASEDDTEVSILADQDFEGDQTPGATFVINLNKGETYSFISTSAWAYNHPQGVKVWVSNAANEQEKKIAVTIFDDSMSRINDETLGSGGCLDSFGDQYIPEDLTGKEYFIPTGNLGSPTINQNGSWRREYIFITSIRDNSIVSINGVNIDTLANGEVLNYQIDQASDYTYVSMSQPGYINHITGAGYGCEQGGAVVAPLSTCNGNTDVTFAHSGPQSDDFSLMLFARNDTVTGSPTKNLVAEEFSLNVNGITYPIPSSFFNYTPDSSIVYLRDDSQPVDDGTDGIVYQYFYNLIPTGNPPTMANMQNSVSNFHLGILNGGSSNGGKYGYFSNFSRKLDAGIGGSNGPTVDFFCSLDSIQLVASGGIDYLWNCTSNPKYNENFSNRFVANPKFKPDTTTGMFYSFSVHISGICNDTTINLEIYVDQGPTSDFTLSSHEICSGDEIIITNNTDKSYADTMTWVFDPPLIEMGDSGSVSFVKTFINISDTIQKHIVKLFSYAEYRLCENIKTDTVYVYPAGTESQFDFTTTNACDSLELNIENLTEQESGDTYFWNFGDGTSSSEFEPEKSYALTESNNEVYQISLITTTAGWGCTDTLIKDVHIPGLVKSEFSVSPEFSCEPAIIMLDPSGLENADSLSWNIVTFSIDSVFSSNTGETTEILIDQVYQDTVFIKLEAFDTNGCSSESSDTVYVYAKPKASFAMSDTNGCTPHTVSFQNQSGISSGTLSYQWDFDGEIISDEVNPEFIFTNNSSENKTYYTRLVAMSDKGCSDTATNSVYVSAPVISKFSISDFQGCPPYLLSFDPTNSLNEDTLLWNVKSSITDSTFGSGANKLVEYYALETETDTIVVTLEALNVFGCSSESKDTIYVYSKPEADFTMDIMEGCSPLFVQMSNTSLGREESMQYFWYSNQNILSVEKDPILFFTNETDEEQNFEVMLVVNSENYCADTISKNLTVYGKTLADIKATKTQACGSIEMQYQSEASYGDSVFYYLTLPNGAASKRLDIDTPYSFSYESSSESTDTVKGFAVVVNSHLCSDTTELPNLYIYQNATADFAAEPDSGLSPLGVVFTNSSTNADSYFWDFDNGLTSNKENINTVFSSEKDTTFQVMLIAMNEHCSDTVYKPVYVYLEDIISLQNKMNDKDLKLYVNQSNQLEFNYSVLSNQYPFAYAVYDLSGKLIVAKKERSLAIGEYTETVDLNNIEPGILIIQTQLNGEIRVRKLSYY